MAKYRFRILNVFAIEGDQFSGNPLCVFEDARGMSDAQMQSLALQFNLSESTFVFPSETATGRVRIFTPSFEMPFAGHPTLGTAHVVRSVLRSGNAVTLEMKAGVIPVEAQGDTWTLQANAPRTRPAEATREQLAQMLAIDPSQVAGEPLWVNAGSEQLIIPLRTAAAVDSCLPNLQLLEKHARVSDSRQMAYVWAPVDDTNITARFFFRNGSAVIEDPATGSACANLGGWFLAQNTQLPLARLVLQGRAVRRPSQLGLRIDAQRQVLVSGAVVEVGAGEVTV
jgi:PhzF family phenazine biosynthesis protein